MEFKAWPKTPRLFRDIVITEKIDGTNACVVIRKDAGPMAWPIESEKQVTVEMAEGVAYFTVAAQSRNRLIHPGMDNAGFASWVWKNASALVEILGEGHHYGEWWGSGIQRGYGLTKGEKRFSLFNTSRWDGNVNAGPVVPGLGVVPELYRGSFDGDQINRRLNDLRIYGSQAAPGFMKPEGIVVYHAASKQVFKVTLDGDGNKWKDAA